MSDSIQWDNQAREKFNQMIERVPVFMRHVAFDTVTKKANELVIKDARDLITLKDMVDAFFLATPFGFHGPMKADMESLGIDYTKYGYNQ